MQAPVRRESPEPSCTAVGFEATDCQDDLERAVGHGQEIGTLTVALELSCPRSQLDHHPRSQNDLGRVTRSKRPNTPQPVLPEEIAPHTVDVRLGPDLDEATLATPTNPTRPFEVGPPDAQDLVRPERETGLAVLYPELVHESKLPDVAPERLFGRAVGDPHDCDEAGGVA